jgi:hypothetical protein
VTLSYDRELKFARSVPEQLLMIGPFAAQKPRYQAHVPISEPASL